MEPAPPEVTDRRATSRSTVRFRAADARDARALSALMEEIHRERRWFVGDAGPTPGSLQRRLRALVPLQELFVVAERGETGGARLVGWVEAHRYVPERLSHVASLTLAVAAGDRGGGIGRSLLRSVTPWARRVGVRKIRLDVRAGNEPAIALYRSEGYVVEGVERDQIRCEDGFEDNVVMACFLAPGDEAAGP